MEEYLISWIEVIINEFYSFSVPIIIRDDGFFNYNLKHSMIFLCFLEIFVIVANSNASNILVKNLEAVVFTVDFLIHKPLPTK